jgi:hypothetical protein
VSYSHQGWVVDERDQSYLLLDDELDEVFQVRYSEPPSSPSDSKFSPPARYICVLATE